VALCRSLAATYPRISCGLTGGRDSRLVAALPTRAGLDVRCHSWGLPDSPDVEIARDIASRFGWRHQVSSLESEDVLAAWAEASQRLVRQNDGLASVWLAPSVLGQDSAPTPQQLLVFGVGGEIARSFYGGPHLFGRNRDSRWVKQYLADGLLRRHDGLLTERSRRLAAHSIDQFVDGAASDGFDPVDVPDLFYAFDRVRRWGGTTLCSARPQSDVAAPLCSRPFITAAFSLPAVEGKGQPLHHGLLRELSPELHRMPFDKPGWPHQSPTLLRAGMLLRRQAHHMPWRLRRWLEVRRQEGSPRPALDQAAWLEGKREEIVQACLDRPGSSLWDQIDRSAFESLMARGKRLRAAEVARRPAAGRGNPLRVRGMGAGS
jgi:asparagine synthase (glutamine-hydrolysing)